MIKIKRASQPHGKKEGVKILEDKLCNSNPSIDNIDQIKFDSRLNQIDYCEIGGGSLQDPERWAEFKGRYRDEFEDKIELMDNIMAKKKEKVKVTWIAVFKGDIRKL